MCLRRIWNSETNVFVRPRNQRSEVMSGGRRSAVGGPAVQQNATLKPATFEVRHEISSNFSAFCLPNAVPMQQNHSVSGSEISGCSQPYPGPPVDLRKAANGQSERMAAFGTAHFARKRRGWARSSPPQPPRIYASFVSETARKPSPPVSRS